MCFSPTNLVWLEKAEGLVQQLWFPADSSHVGTMLRPTLGSCGGIGDCRDATADSGRSQCAVESVRSVA